MPAGNNFRRRFWTLRHALIPAHNTGYDYLDEGYFRLLIIRTVDHDTVRCHLETSRIADSGAYDALSYVWGKQPRSETIWNGSHAIKVTPDLKESLINFHRHRGRFGIFRLWIDAVCINQDDEAEKMVQIQQMRYIYSNATQNLVWLGMSNCDSEELCAYMTKVIRLNAESSKHEYDHFRHHNTDFLSRTLFIFQHDWFNRLWVIQEVVLAREVKFIYGISVIPWTTLSAYLETYDLVNILDIQTLTTVTDIMVFLKKRAHKDELYYTLDAARQRKSTCEKDHILGIIGLLDPENAETLKNLGALSTTDHEHWTSFFTRFLRAYITSRQHASDERKLLIHYNICRILDSAWTSEKHEWLPNWCPDWTKPQPREALIAQSNSHAGSRMLRGLRDYGIFTPLVVPLLDTLHVRVHGFFVDVIESTVNFPHENNKADILEWVEAYLSICPGYDVAQPQAVPNAFWRTLICNTVDRRQDCSRADVQYYYDWINRLRAAAGRTAQNEDDYVYDQEKAINHNVRMSSKCEARKFFTTRDGRIGLGTLGVEAGDSVCVFYGAMACFIVRFDQGEHAPALLMGDAYVHGLMHGAGLEGRPEPDDSFITLR